MPPRIDPYANKTHKRIDVILVLVTVVLIAFAFRTAAQQRINSATLGTNNASAAQSQQATSK
jgi:hypothetical protein